MSHVTSTAVLPEQPASALRDGLGITASLACAVHCAAMPFLIAYLPALGLSFLADESFHQWMTGACLLLALVAFIPGWRTHRQWVPGTIAGVGLTIIAAAAFGQSDECCVACTTTADPAETADSKLPDQQGTLDHEVCTLGCCKPAAVTDSEAPDVTAADETTIAAENVNSSPILLALAGWWTPLGGMLLVSAHLLNRRYTCCACCSGEDPACDDLTMDSKDPS